MKKLIFLLSIVLLFASCEKEPEPEPESQTLIEFLEGEWTCNRQMVQGHQADFSLTFTEENYVLVVDFAEPLRPTFTTVDKTYQLFEEKKIRLDYPYTPDSYIVEYDVAWTELNQANMSWTPRPTNERNLTSNPTILTRTRK